MTGLIYAPTNDYRPLKLIGEGGTATVYAAENNITKQKYAIKCIKFRNKSEKSSDKVFQNEINILKSIDHPNVAALHEYFTGPQHHFLVMEFAEGGDLLDDLQKRGRYSEEHAKSFAIEIMRAVRYCHDRNIVHRDLKPENILIDKFGCAKLADFGLSKRIQKPNSLTTRCGTLIYMAPEILDHDTYGKAVDIWSSGIIIFIMLAGYHPFAHESQDASREMIRKGKLCLYPSYWDDKSAEAISLIKDMICVCPSQRITANESLKSSWLGSSDQFVAKKVNFLNPFNYFSVKVSMEMKKEPFQQLRSRVICV